MRNSARFLLVAAAVMAGLAGCSPDTVVVGGERAASEASSTADSQNPAVADDDAPDASSDGTDETESSAGEDGDVGVGDGAVGDGDEGAADDGGDTDAGEAPASAAELEQSEGFGLGSEEQVESLLVDCTEGNDLACDVLFQISAFDSVEEATALACGGRSDVEMLFCTADIDAAEGELTFDPDSPGLDAIVDRCEISGDMTACDFLYYRSPLESSFEEIGATCGGRVPVAVPDCRTFLTESD